MQFEGLRLETPSGKVEIASAAAEADGHARLPRPLADARPPEGRLRLLSPASAWTLNDTFANDPKVDRRLGTATVTLHPLDAAERGLADGDACVLESGEGSLGLTVAVDDIAPRGVALSPKGRWPKREPGSANVNVLNPGVKADMGASSAVHGVEVTVRAVR
jgi:anaerobic selenocysteine-containing dehydrogenase